MWPPAVRLLNHHNAPAPRVSVLPGSPLLQLRTRCGLPTTGLYDKRSISIAIGQLPFCIVGCQAVRLLNHWMCHEDMHRCKPFSGTVPNQSFSGPKAIVNVGPMLHARQQQASHGLWGSAGYSRPLFHQAILTCKLGQAGLLLGMRSGFFSRSVHARLEISVCSGYDLFHSR